MLVNEVGNRINEDHHHYNGDHDSHDHDNEVIGEAHRGNNRVNREHDIHHHDGCNGLREADLAKRFMLFRMLGLLFGKRQHVAKLIDALINKVGAAEQQHEVAHAEAMSPEAKVKREQRLGHMHQIACEAQEDAARNHGRPKGRACDRVLFFGWKPT